MKTQDFYQFSLWLLAEETRIYECLPGEPRPKCNSQRQATNVGREELAWSTNLASGREKKRKKGKKATLDLLLEFETLPENRAEPFWVHIKKEQMEMEYIYIKGLGSRRKYLFLYWLSLCMTEESKAAVKTLLLPFWRLQCPQNPMAGF